MVSVVVEVDVGSAVELLVCVGDDVVDGKDVTDEEPVAVVVAVTVLDPVGVHVDELVGDCVDVGVLDDDAPDEREEVGVEVLVTVDVGDCVSLPVGVDVEV